MRKHKSSVRGASPQCSSSTCVWVSPMWSSNGSGWPFLHAQQLLDCPIYREWISDSWLQLVWTYSAAGDWEQGRTRLYPVVLLDANIVYVSCFDDQWMLPPCFYHSPRINAFKIALLPLLKQAKNPKPKTNPKTKSPISYWYSYMS